MLPTAFDLEIENYRTFSAPPGARISFKRGLTAFVGPNNSGKSNILRLLFEMRRIFKSAAWGLLNLNASPNVMRGEPVELNGVRDPEAIFSNTNRDDLRLTLHIVPTTSRQLQPGSEVTTPAQFTMSLRRDSARLSWGIVDGSVELPGTMLEFAGDSWVRQVGHPERLFDISAYVSILELLSQSVYIASFRNLTNQGANSDYYDLVIGDAFVERWSAAQGGATVRSARAVMSVTRELEHVFGFENLQIVASHDRKTLRFSIGGQPYGVDELGAGVSQFLITLFNLEVNPPGLTLIDEPEIGLHPQLQIDFVTSIAKRSRFGVLFSTHNLGLARSAGDRVYTLTRTGPAGASVLREFDAINNPVEFVGELSYAGNYDLGYRKIVLVEGPTEIKLIRRLLQRLGAAQRVTLISLGGSSSMSGRSTHGLVELRRLSDQVFAVVDSERQGPTQSPIPERRAFKRNCTRLGIDCHVLERRSIECYFSERAIKSVLGDDFRELGPVGAVPSNWPKELNWKIADAMELDEFTGPDLIDFLKRVVAA
jgi:putative AbiEii toxin of type IV toxin-antitoxin system/AAA ATPase-like protein